MTNTASMTTNHLSEAQIDDALIGDLAAEASAHLSTCAACRQQVAEARLPIENFKSVSIAWSERQSATMPVSLGDGRLHTRGLSQPASWGAAIVALVAVLAAVPVLMRQSSHANADNPVQVETAQIRTTSAVGATGVVSGQTAHFESNPEQIARDNQMLDEIDRELDSNTENPAMLGLEVSGQQSARASNRAVQD